MRVRKLIGKLSQWLFPFFGTCARCGRTWNVCEPHTTMIERSDHSARGVFSLCESCWRELSIDERLPYYRMNYTCIWREHDHEGALWYRIERAVREGK